MTYASIRPTRIHISISFHLYSTERKVPLVAMTLKSLFPQLSTTFAYEILKLLTDAVEPFCGDGVPPCCERAVWF